VNCTFYVIPSKTDGISGAGTAYPSGEREFNISSPPCRFYKLPCTIHFYDIPSMVCFLIIRYDISRFVTIPFGISAYLLAGNTKCSIKEVLKSYHFITDHFPYMNNNIEDSKQWQLLENPLTLEVYSKFIKPSKEARHFGLYIYSCFLSTL
jgi:hypothetical protein